MPEKKPKVLVVEDDPFMTTLLSEEFLREGFEVAHAGTGDAAVKIFQAERPDAVILDLILPGEKNGIEALEELRKQEAGGRVPVVILSNVEEPKYVNRARELGVAGYLVKANVQLPEIVAKVKEALKR